MELIRDWLADDDFSATWIFDKLKGLGYTDGYETVRGFVRDVKGQRASRAYIRFKTEPGRQAQMDWADCNSNSGTKSESFISRPTTEWLSNIGVDISINNRYLCC